MVLWKTPTILWLKVNTDGSVNSHSVASGGILRDYMANFCGGYAQNIRIQKVLHAELMAMIFAMEIADKKGWSHIFREGDACADRLESMGHSFVVYNWWDSLPLVLRDTFLREKLGVPSYRLV
jgi:hypothetical protein